MSRCAAVMLLLLAAWGCAREDNSGEVAADAVSAREAPAAAGSLPDVVVPDLSNVSPAAADQIRSAFETVSRARRDGAPASALADAFGTLGHVLRAAAFWDSGAASYRNAARLAPGDARWPYFEAHASLARGDRDGAAAAFERAIALQPANEAALVWLGDVYLDQARLQDAKAAFSRALAVTPESAAAAFGAGRAALALREYRDAVTHFERALSLAPQANAVHYPLASAYRALGNTAAANAHLARRGTRGPSLNDPLMDAAAVTLDTVTAHERRGMDALQRQDWAGAAAAFRRGLALDPGDRSIRYWLGTALYVSGETAAAEREFRAVLREDPGFARAHYSLGALLAARGDRAGALAAYAEAVRTAPTMPEAHVRMADTLQALDRPREAIAHYEEAIRLDPGQLDAWLGGARLLIATGDRVRSRAWLDQARQVHPANRELGALEARMR